MDPWVGEDREENGEEEGEEGRGREVKETREGVTPSSPVFPSEKAREGPEGRGLRRSRTWFTPHGSGDDTETSFRSEEGSSHP